MIQDIVILGASGFAKEILFLIERNNAKEVKWNIRGFIDNEIEPFTEILGYPVLGNDDWLIKQGKSICAVCAVGNPTVRKKIIDKYNACSKILFPNIIDNSVIMSKHVQLGNGCIICAGTILTVDISIGDFVIINLDCTVGHDVKINDYVTLYPSVNISGNVMLGNELEIGTGTHIIQGISICDHVVIGAGSVVIRDIVEKCIVAGNPVKKIR